MEKINELLLKTKYQNGKIINWQEIADEIGVSTETLRRLRLEGFYDGLRWVHIQRLAKFLGMKAWELVKIIEENG